MKHKGASLIRPAGLLGWTSRTFKSTHVTSWQYHTQPFMHSFGFEHALQFQIIKWIHFNQASVNFCMMFYCLCRCMKTVYLILRRQRHNTIFNLHVFCLFIYSVSQHTWTAVFLQPRTHLYLFLLLVWQQDSENWDPPFDKRCEKLTLNWFQMNNSASKLEGWNWPNSGHCVWNKDKRTNAWNTTVLIAKGYQLIHWMKHWNKPLWHCKIPLKGYYKFPRREEEKEKKWIPRVRKA